MKIVNRKEFLKLPEYTFYMKYTERFAFEDIHVKGESLASNDWICYYPGDIDSTDSGDYGNKLDDMMEGRLESCPVSDAWGRDGCFEQDAYFMIFEQADLLNIKSLAEKALAARETKEAK